MGNSRALLCAGGMLWNRAFPSPPRSALLSAPPQELQDTNDALQQAALEQLTAAQDIVYEVVCARRQDISEILRQPVEAPSADMRVGTVLS